MSKYHKINSIYKRDMDQPRSPFIIGQYSTPELELLKNIQWEWQEKIDGTNIRIVYDGKGGVELRGRTDNAILQKHLAAYLESVFTVDVLARTFSGSDTGGILYGEGYGMKIQKGGNYLKDSVGFILFDVRVGEWWLQRHDVEVFANDLGIPVTPVIGHGTLDEAVEFVKSGFKSTIAENKDYDAEGLVLRPKHALFDRAGRRIITKVKHKDFK